MLAEYFIQWLVRSPCCLWSRGVF